MGHDHGLPGLKVKVVGQGQRSMQKYVLQSARYLQRPVLIGGLVAVEVGFHCDVISCCELALRDIGLTSIID